MMSEGTEGPNHNGDPDVWYANRSVIVGGDSNYMFAPFSSIVGGNGNKVYGNGGFSFVGGGQNNSVSGSAASVIVGGFNNNVVAFDDSFDNRGWNGMVTGNSNLIAGSNNFIGAGSNIRIGFVGEDSSHSNVYFSSIVGGSNNVIYSGQENAIVGGSDITLGFTYTGEDGVSGYAGPVRTFVGSGNSNSVSQGNNHAIVNGSQCRILGGGQNFIGSGESNQIQAGAGTVTQRGFIGNGQQNKISIGVNSFIGSGQRNVIGSTQYDNGSGVDYVGFNSSIIGGSDNTVLSPNSTILGGYQNGINHGHLDEANVLWDNGASTVLGGRNNWVVGGPVVGSEGATAMGMGALARTSGARVFASGFMAADEGGVPPGDAQFCELVWRGKTLGQAENETISLGYGLTASSDDPNPISTAWFMNGSDTTVAYAVNIQAIANDGTHSKAFFIRGMATANAFFTSSEDGDIRQMGDDSSTENWSMSVSAGMGLVTIGFTTGVGNTVAVKVVAMVSITELKF